MALKGPGRVEGCVHFEENDLKQATNQFDERLVSQGGCKLGEGGFGPVYKAKLKCTEVAIKVLKLDKVPNSATERLAGEQFETEVRSLTKYRHPNLVVLLGYHNSPSLKALLDGRSQEGKTKISHIHLPWMCRISIATDTARGLAYLHTADTMPLVHRDVKSANVLLDLAFRAKVGDFGLARALQESGSTSTSRVVGTSGYIPPEYYHGRITTKMDTYSFGVILLEILSGLAPYDSQRSPKDLVTYMEQDMDKDIAPILCTKIDGKAGDWPSESFVQLFRIARECVQKISLRPEMTQVYNKLEALMTKSAQEYAEFTKKSER
eukprot:Em0009g51a